MIHDIGMEISGFVSIKEAENEHREADILNCDTNVRMSVHCHGPKQSSYFTKLLSENSNRDVHMDALDALKHKIADVAQIPKLETRVYVQRELLWDEEDNNNSVTNTLPQHRKAISELKSAEPHHSSRSSRKRTCS